MLKEHTDIETPFYLGPASNRGWGIEAGESVNAKTGYSQLSDIEGYDSMVYGTVGGLIVGILAYFGYNYLTSKISDVVFTMENATIGFMDVLNDPESAATVKIEE